MIKEEAKFHSSTVFEGMTSIRAIIDNLKANKPNARRILRLLFDRTRMQIRIKELHYLQKMGELFDFSVELVGPDIIEMYTLGTSHGGIIALCSERSYDFLNESHIKDNGFYVMIDGIEDPYNFGYALRSIYASGADGIVLSMRNWMHAAGVVCRSSAGASERLDAYIADDNFIDLFKSKGYKIVCADMDNSVSVYEADLKKPLFLIVGGEKRGISRNIIKQADQIIRIDYGRDFDAALSAASAATILSFEVFRNNK